MPVRGLSFSSSSPFNFFFWRVAAHTREGKAFWVNCLTNFERLFVWAKRTRVECSPSLCFAFFCFSFQLFKNLILFDFSWYPQSPRIIIIIRFCFVFFFHCLTQDEATATVEPLLLWLPRIVLWKINVQRLFYVWGGGVFFLYFFDLQASWGRAAACERAGVDADEICELQGDPEALDHPQPSPLLSSLSTLPWGLNFSLEFETKNNVYFYMLW